MTIIVRWDDPDYSITRLTFIGPVSVSELFDAWKQEASMQNNVCQPVYSLNDLNRVQVRIREGHIPQLISFIKSNKPAHLQMTIQVTADPKIRHSLQMIARFMPHEVHVVTTFAEAYRRIGQHKSRLSHGRVSLPVRC
jgi:hypothetical protein